MTKVSLEKVLAVWRERCQLTGDEQQAIMVKWLGEPSIENDASSEDEGAAILEHPQFKPMMVEFLLMAIGKLHAAWAQTDSKAQLKKMDKSLREAGDMRADSFLAALSDLYVGAFAELLWSHPAYQLKFRTLFDDKKDVLDSLKTAQPWEVDAVVSEVCGNQDEASIDSVKHRVAAALNNLGHFTAKPTHTAAAVVGVILPSEHAAVGPYLTSGQLMVCGDDLPLDQIANVGALVGPVLKILNEGSDCGEPETAQAIRAATDELLREGVAPKEYSIDPRLKQLLLPVGGGESDYLSVTPLTSMGLSARIHARVDLKKSFAKDMRYGYSATAIGNFTAIRKTQSAIAQDKVIGDIPNKALMFDLPSVNVEFVTLKRAQMKPFSPFITRQSLLALYEARVSNNASAEEKELTRIILGILNQLGQMKKECVAALRKSKSGAESLPQLEADKTVIREFLLCDDSSDESDINFFKLPEAIAESCYSALDAARFHAEKKNDVSLGLSVKDKNQFMRWVPELISDRLTLIWG
ncbi:hypothetical protein ABHF91_09695 [Pseudaeromonas sp. ZJS20]|uniref:hypothetical protein n=1 Tax=Pseudaeromonas aegiceratis TaxID=3153928 RepID=UPI00390C7E96